MILDMDFIKLAELVMTGKATTEQELSFYERLHHKE